MDAPRLDHAHTSVAGNTLITYGVDDEALALPTEEAVRVAVEALSRWRDAGHTKAKLVFVCHSMGGLIARYAAMYGDADLPPDDVAIRPTWQGATHIRTHHSVLWLSTERPARSDSVRAPR